MTLFQIQFHMLFSHWKRACVGHARWLRIFLCFSWNDHCLRICPSFSMINVSSVWPYQFPSRNSIYRYHKTLRRCSYYVSHHNLFGVFSGRQAYDQRFVLLFLVNFHLNIWPKTVHTFPEYVLFFYVSGSHMVEPLILLY